MLSRVADSLLWMSRYLERAEHTSRLLDVHLHLMLDQSPAAALERWRKTLEALQLPPEEDEGGEVTPRLEAMTFDTDNSASVVSAIGMARENARQIREQISSEMFEELNRLYLYARNPKTRERFAVEPHAFYQAVKDGAHLFQGITDSTLTHGQGWRFIQAGRFLERAGSVASLLAVHLAGLLSANEEELAHTNTYLELLGLLKSCTAWEAYCKVYSADLRPDNLAEFLLLSAEFPHSVHYAVEQLVQALRAIAEETGARQSRPLDQLAGRVRATLRFSPIEEILSSSLERFLGDIRSRLDEINEGIYRLYITDHFEF